MMRVFEDRQWTLIGFIIVAAFLSNVSGENKIQFRQDKATSSQKSFQAKSSYKSTAIGQELNKGIYGSKVSTAHSSNRAGGHETHNRGSQKSFPKAYRTGSNPVLPTPNVQNSGRKAKVQELDVFLTGGTKSTTRAPIVVPQPAYKKPTPISPAEIDIELAASTNTRTRHGAASLVFVFDTTGSMYPDLVQVIDGAAKFLATALARPEKAIYNYILVPFQDPEVGPATITKDPEKFQSLLRELYVQGGGDCPEMSITALKVALEKCLPNSFIYVFTDASAKDTHLTDEVLALVQEKQSQVVFVLTGTCNGYNDPGYLVYERIATASSGQVFNIDKNRVNQVLDFVRVSLQATKVYLATVVRKRSGSFSINIPVDKKLMEITISVSGKNPQITAVSPSGKQLSAGKGLKVLLKLRDSTILAVKKPEKGKWKFSVSCTSKFTIRITGLSLFNFYYGFAVNPTQDIYQTFSRPLKSFQNYLLIVTNELQVPGKVTEVFFVNYQNEILLKKSVAVSKNSMYLIPDITVPKEEFFVEISGVDNAGYKFIRSTPTALSPIKAPAPKILMLPREQVGYQDRSMSIKCTVKSALPFEVTWLKNKQPIGSPRKYKASTVDAYTITKLKAQDAAEYSCKAVSQAGFDLESIVLSVSEAPPKLLPSGVVYVVPGGEITLKCATVTKGDYKYQWLMDKAGSLNLQTLDSDHKILPDGSLLLRNVNKRMLGTYVCRVSNTAGFSELRVPLKFYEKPVVGVDKKVVSFKQGSDITLRCFSSSIPQVSFTWFRRGESVHQNPRVRSSQDGSLIIRRAQREDEGVWQCKGSNAVGSSSADINLSYLQKPVVSVLSPQVVVKLGQTAALVCQIEGSPKPKVTWFKSGSKIDNSRSLEESKLMIYNVKEKDVGIYECEARNEVGSDKRQIRLLVGVMPEITKSPGNQKVNIFTNIILVCEATGKPQPSIKWQREQGKQMEPARFIVDRNGRLQIIKFRKDDEGVYTCIASNQYGSDRKDSYIESTGAVKPRFHKDRILLEITEGERITLTCRVSAGVPPPSVKWYRRGVVVKREGDLVIQRASASDQGDYVCVATNLAGTATQVTTLKLRSAPSIDPSPREFFVELGMSVQLPCKVHGTPRPKVSWKKDGKSLDEHDRNFYISNYGSFSINVASHSSVGMYVCTATNVLGSTQKELVLRLKLPPKILDDIHEITLRSGEKAVLPCTVEKTMDLKIEWLRDKTMKMIGNGKIDITSDGSLVFKSAAESDAGVYECVASNHFGRASKVVRLKVTGVVVSDSKVPAVIVGILGQPVELQCIIPCMGPAVRGSMVLWKYQNEIIHFDPISNCCENRHYCLDPQTGSLMIPALELRDKGMYTCYRGVEPIVAENTLQLEVHVPPMITAIENDTPTYDSSTKVSIKCYAVGYPVPEIQWFRGNETVKHNYRQLDDATFSTLDIDRAKTVQSEVFVCMAKNIAGFDLKEYTLQGIQPPRFTEAVGVNQARTRVFVRLSSQIGNHVTLWCNVTGSPEPSIEWFKDNKMIHSYKPHQTSEHIQNNYHFTHHDTFPNPNTEPELATNQYEQYDQQGNSLHLDFPHNNFQNPSPMIGQSFFPNKLDIMSVRREDYGKYVCIASNPSGKAQKIVDINFNVRPYFTDGKKQSVVKNIRGKFVTLECPAAGSPNPTVKWFKEGKEIGHNDPTFHIDSQDTSLKIINSGSQVNGNFECKAANILGEICRKFHVKVLDGPKIKFSDEITRITVKKGAFFNLRCEASGYPAPRISWSRGGIPIDMNLDRSFTVQRDGDLVVVRQAKLTHGGEYECTATNEIGTARKQYIVTVLVPIKLDRRRYFQEVRTDKGFPVLLNCVVLEGRTKETKVEWFKNGKKLENRPNGRINIHGFYQEYLKIDPLDFSDHGSFTCVAKNSFSEDSVKYVIIVLDHPRIKNSREEIRISVKEGAPLSLLCEATGYPTPKLTWSKDGSPLDEARAPSFSIQRSGAQVVMRNAQPSHRGQYACTAGNEIGAAFKYYIVTVQAHIKLDRTRYSEYVKLRKGQPLILTCIIIAGENKDTKIVWTKDGKQVVEGWRNRHVKLEGARKRTLKIASVTSKDLGSYSCKATNGYSSDLLKFNVIILESPTIKYSKDIAKITVNEGSPLVLDCQASGNPTPKITWSKEKSPLERQYGRSVGVLKNGAVVSFPKAMKNTQQGEFACKAVNEVGEANKRFNVSVVASIQLDRSKYVDEVVVLKGQRIVLSCLISKGQTKATKITWFKDRRQVSYFSNRNIRLDGPYKGTLTISSANPNDKASYSCVANNGFSKDSLMFNVKVLVPARIDVRTSTKESTVTVVKKSVKFFCDAHGLPTPTIRWFFNHEPIDFRARKSFTLSADKKNLEIKLTGTRHKGTYTCQARNEAGSDQRNFHLSLYVPPRIHKQEENQVITVNKGSTVHFRCQATGIPKPKIAWYDLKNQKITPTARKHFKENELWIVNVKMSDAGSLYCEAVNVAGKTRKSFTLRVQIPPTIDLANLMDNPKVALGRLAILECPAEGFPPPKVTWTFNKQPLDQSGKSGVVLQKNSKIVRIAKVTREHAGSYTCVVENSAGVVRKTIKLEILLPVMIKDGDKVTELYGNVGKSVEMVCEAVGKPAPSFIWLKDGVPTTDMEDSTFEEQDKGKKLVIKKVQETDSGKYTCIASNAAGQKKKLFSLIIYVPVSIAPGGPQGKLTVSEGHSLELLCDARGSPAPKITWYKNNVKVDPYSLTSKYSLSKDHRVFSFLSSSTFDSGVYKCVASGKSGTASKIFTVEIRGHVVQKVVNREESLKLHIGKSAKLICDSRLKGGKIKWFKNNVEINTRGSNNARFLDNGRIMEILKLSQRDKGVISCMVENSSQKLVKIFKIIFLELPEILISVKSYEGKVGKALALSARVSGRASITWFKDGQRLNITPQSRYVMDRDGTLHITQITSADAGVYRVQATSGGGSVFQEIRVFVAEAPMFEDKSMRVVRAIEKKPITMKCEAKGYPKPKITWEKDHQALRNDRTFRISANGLLTINSVDRSNEGLYVCKAQNNAGMARLEFMLKIHVGPVIEVNSKRVEGALGSELVVPCTAIGEPAPTVRWMKDGKEIISGGRFKKVSSGWLAISGAQAEDAGVYRCIAQNQAGNQFVDIVVSLKESVRLKVDGDEIVKGRVGADARLVCRSSNHGRVTWSRDGKPISEGGSKYLMQENGQVLVVKRLESNDAGAYTCSSGSQSIQFHINLLNAPVVKMSMKHTALAEGGQLEVKCDVDAASRAKVKWFINGVPFEDLRQKMDSNRLFSVSQPYLGQSKLVIDQLTAKDSGTYKCQATNNGGTSFAEALVQIKADSVSACRKAGCQYKCSNTGSRGAQCLCPNGFTLNYDGKTCIDTDECKTGAAHCKASEKCFNTKGGFRCIDVTCPAPYKKDAVTGLCVHKCDSFNGLCKEGSLFYRDVLHFMFVSVNHDAAVDKTLFKISAYDEKTRFLPNATFHLQNAHSVPFRIRKGNDSKALVYTVQPLKSNDLHSLKIKAVSKDLDRSDLVLKTTFYVYVAVSEFSF